MPRCASSILAAVVALCAVVARARRTDDILAESEEHLATEHLAAEQSALPPKIPELIAEIIGLKDIHKVSLRTVLDELEREHHFQAEVLAPHKSTIKALTLKELKRVEHEAQKDWKGLGESCEGTRFWDQGTCSQPNEICTYPTLGTAVDRGHQGICRLKHHERCYQKKPGDGTSGGCDKPFTCRSFRFWSKQGNLMPSSYDMAFGTTDVKVKSYCVKADSREDNNLSFLSYFHMLGTEYFVGERVYKTD